LREFSPLRRLVVLLHECAHMALYATMNWATYKTIPAHGMLFKDMLKKLVREHNFRPVFKDVLSSHIVQLVNMDDGVVTDVDAKWTIVR